MCGNGAVQTPRRAHCVLVVLLLWAVWASRLHAFRVTCDSGVRTQVHMEASNGPSAFLAFNMPLDELVAKQVIERLAVARASALVVVERGDVDSHGHVLRLLVRAGHHLCMKNIPALVGVHATAESLAQALDTEMGFLDAPLNKLPQFVRDQHRSYGAEFLNASQAAGTFAVDLDTPVPGVLFVNDDALESAESGALQGKRTGIEPFLDSEQLHCLYDRIGCDQVARMELYYLNCQRLRAEFYRRERVDLWKYASRRGRYRGEEPQVAGPVEAKVQDIIAQNRMRINIAHERIKQGALLREVMLTLYTLSDQQLRGDYMRALDYEMERLDRRIIRGIFALGVLLLALATYSLLRFPPTGFGLSRKFVEFNKSA
ncbi:hypothetical protein FVE85_0144 [Porphyridium purpureum]|uniref:Uncharacterized protein n=1 Tax=Porphyridium purpureum TaxID=35688 RepID=A0A5J4YZ67_PORPP|nr:hypothetical protein FVE85_0144 [Porphyridium purpureum]|eukprot:POR2771..scf208_2